MWRSRAKEQDLTRALPKPHLREWKGGRRARQSGQLCYSRQAYLWLLPTYLLLLLLFTCCLSCRLGDTHQSHPDSTPQASPNRPGPHGSGSTLPTAAGQGRL